MKIRGIVILISVSLIWSGSDVSAYGRLEDAPEAWKIMVVDLQRMSFIEDSMRRITAKEGHIIQVVSFEVENSANVADTLHIDLDSLVVTDIEGRSYVSVGAGTSPKRMVVVYTMTDQASGSRRLILGDGTQIGFLLAMDDVHRFLGIELAEQSTAVLKFAFAVPVDSTDLVLHWPGMQPLALDETMLPRELVPSESGTSKIPGTWGQLKAMFHE